MLFQIYQKTIVIILKYLHEKEEIKSVYWQENKQKQQVAVVDFSSDR